MKIHIRTLSHGLLLLALPVTAYCSDMVGAEPDITGSWSGTFQMAQYEPVRLIFHITAEEDGGYSARLEVPARQGGAIPAETTELRDGRLRISLPDIQAEFMGGLRESRDGTRVQRIDGDWSQFGEFIPLTLQPCADGDCSN